MHKTCPGKGMRHVWVSPGWLQLHCATCFSSPEGNRGGVLAVGQKWGFDAGLKGGLAMPLAHTCALSTRPSGCDAGETGSVVTGSPQLQWEMALCRHTLLALV